ncbi:dipeptidase [Sporolactobacillus inulinus]|uniref:Peptidase M20 n=2 Tax=Sporolactobacillus inulinus TaxID=2078 RepID=A0A0U1QLK2_9BACL|nr:dipeptidase [Sporolactobacillus inulinus]KLI01700.1 peptidase M20 [Sporolactobacillus inulinus CASD]GEB76009.1 peptidase M20 [Sporolactobacillus inulinus]
MEEPIVTTLEKNRDRYLKQMIEFLSIPSISSDSTHKADVRRAAEWLANDLKNGGLRHVQILETAGHPVVYADYLTDENKPTVLCYGHYDVQPVDPVDQWQTDPFKPEIRDDIIYGRGTSDDKGQVFMLVKMAETILEATGTLPVNLKFCFEGEEEIGSAHLDGFVDAHLDLLKADVLLVSDTTMLGMDQPAVSYGLRGICGLEVRLRGPKGDLHSGVYGGAVQNTLHAMVDLLASLHDHHGRVTVDGFYDQVKPLTNEERKVCETLSDDDALKKELDVDTLYGEEGYPTVARIWSRPTLELNGVYGGFQGEGLKTVIPSTATAKITCRLVPDQDPALIGALLKKHLKDHLPAGVKLEVELMDHADPFIMPVDHPALQAAHNALEKAFHTKAILSRQGGSVPIVNTFHDKLGLAPILMGFGLDSENFHAPNEHFHLKNFDRGLRALTEFLFELSKQMN